MMLPRLNLAAFTLRRYTESWFFISAVSGASDANPNVPVLLSATQGRNGPGTVTLVANAYDYTTGVLLGSVTVAFTSPGTVKVTIPASYTAPGALFTLGHGVYVEVQLTDSTDTSPAPQARYQAVGFENGG